MKVVVNQLAALGQKAGIGYYTTELLRCLREQCGADEIADYPTGWARRAARTFKGARPYLEVPFTWGRGNRGGNRSFLVGQRSRWLGQLRDWGRRWLAHRFPAVCARQGYDLYHEPNFIPFPCDRPTVVTIHDLSVLLHPEWHPADRVAYFDKNFHKGMAQCRHFLAISDFGRQEVIRTLGIPPERVTRTYMGIRPGLGPVHRQEVSRVLHDLGLPPRYLLYVGTIEPRKNILMLLRAYCALPHGLRSAWPLLLVGNWGWNTAHIAEFYHHEARHRGVIHVGYVKNKSLAAVYTGARALVYPSLYEGFGLPPVEMMACGGAVLASTAGALVETIGSRAHLIPPQDIDGWIATMTRVLLDDDWCFSLRRGVAEIAKPFTWDLCAAETLTVYRTLCNEERVSNAA
jgi:alpha-1,3-rhamnosyl/mannosyltransferase